MPLPFQMGIFQAAPEPMQVDTPPEENENIQVQNHVVESSNLDLESYAAQYKGLARLSRLMYIADHCPPLRVEALRMALVHVQLTYNTAMYQQVHKKLQEAITSQSILPDAIAGVVHNVPALDTQWMETTAKKAALKLEKLDTDLKNYKSNSIKESIRRGHDDLGDHYLDCGDLSNALKCYSRARDYCTSAKHVINMCLNVIKVSIYLHNWSHVISYVNKAEAMPATPQEQQAPSKDGSQSVATRLKCAAGLAELATKKYKSAAKYFLQANFDHCDFPELLSANNVATYGALCALATFDRQELQRNVIASSAFKQFLELDPQLRDILHQFYDSKYASCLRLLDQIKDNLLLDMYLAPHVTELYTQIRNRALCQYFSPYLSAEMVRMAEAFNTSLPALEDELMALILNNQINARIDSHNKEEESNGQAFYYHKEQVGCPTDLILYAKDADQRSQTFEKSLAMGADYERRTTALILRSAMLRHGICVKSPPRDDGSGGEMSLTPGNGGARN